MVRTFVRRLWRSVVARTALLTVIGSLGSSAVYAVGSTGGTALCAVFGGLAGIIVSLSLGYRSGVELTQVTLSVPMSITFMVAGETRLTARKIRIEMVSRIAVRPLEDGAGIMREALSSLREMMLEMRSLLKEVPPTSTAARGDSLDEIVEEILTLFLGPFLAHWHTLLTEWENETSGQPESAWPEQDGCRLALKQLQADLRPYVVALGRIAGYRDPERIYGLVQQRFPSDPPLRAE